jgi:hypothetical protein
LYARLRDRAVIGERWIAGFGAAVVDGDVEGDGSAAAPPVVAAPNAGAAATAETIKLDTTLLTVRARKTTTSFVGLRG